MRKIFLLGIQDTDLRISIAFKESGTVLDEPFLVLLRKAILFSKSICSYLSPSISDLLIAVSSAN